MHVAHRSPDRGADNAGPRLLNGCRVGSAADVTLVGDLVLLAEVEQDRITILATDCGPGIEDIEQAMVPGYSTAPDWVRELGFGAGMGLYNIKKCSDDFKILSTIGKGTELRIDIFLSPDKE